MSSYERPEVKCFNCNGTGHRVRDCPEPRHDKFACRNCGYVFDSMFRWVNC
jgi:Fe2+ or Zn2+ uptake regulation protein